MEQAPGILEPYGLGDAIRPNDGDEDIVSDADSDEMELRGDIAKFDQSVREFLSSHQGTVTVDDEDEHELKRPRAAIRSKAAPRSTIRGPRQAAEPRGDIKFRLARVNQAFMSGEYDRARNLVFEIIRINAETHQAWTVLASIFREEGLNDKALMAMVIAAHLRPKDGPGWMSCASFAMSLAEEGQDGALKTALMCYSSAVKAQPTNLDARLGRAEASQAQGFLSQAITEFSYVLERRPFDIGIVRRLAEACADLGGAEDVQRAVVAYQTYFTHAHAEDRGAGDELSWHDVGIFVELFACAGDYTNAILQLKSLSRWMLGRQNEGLWDECVDDREWDKEHTRRLQIPPFNPSTYDLYTYGLGLPLEFRARLALYRLKIRDNQESNLHLRWLDPTESATATAVQDFPYLIRDIADELYMVPRISEALDYYELLRHSIYGQDATLLLQLGRCYLARSDLAAAEDCFLVAIQVDETNIDARIELARIYEKAKEEEEALILLSEAAALDRINDGGNQLEDSSGHPNRSRGRASALSDGTKPRRQRDQRRRPTNNGVVRTRYRPRKLVAPDQRLQEERARADELTRRYEVVRNLKRDIQAGDHSLIPQWMAAAGELVGDFRSFRKFYPWDKYLKFLGAANDVVFSASSRTQPGLSELAERLSKTPSILDDRRINVAYEDDGYRGIPFREWLELFLDYAVSLALANRAEEAYQIKMIDASHLSSSQVDRHREVSHREATSPAEAKQLDICLLMLYGHILFTSTSYTFALNYFLRARTLDPLNPMISLSVGLGYIHHALKRQADNRQYLIMQGFACVFEFCHSKLMGTPDERREAFFGVGRTFHMLGLHHLALEWYRKVLGPEQSQIDLQLEDVASRDVILSAAYNEYALFISSGNVDELEHAVLPRLVLLPPLLVTDSVSQIQVVVKMSSDGKLRILLIGNGGREHALAWKLSQSPLVESIYAVPGNGGTATCPKVTNVTDIAADDYPALVQFAQSKLVGLVVPGPEAPLVDGVEAYFRAAAIPCFGPSKEAAQMEGSKTFSKDFMKRHNIPTAAYENFSNYEKAVAYLDRISHDVVIKATGLAAGKGVIIPTSKAEAQQALKEIMVDKAFGNAGDEVVIEEFLIGDELSILTFSDGNHTLSLPPAQDHKRIGDGDQGPNTGGMGCYAPTTIATTELIRQIEDEVIEPTITGMRKECYPFRGVLFTGLMITPKGPKVLEYNVRFGDPETQTVLPLLSEDTDLAEIMLACTAHEARLDCVSVKIEQKFSATVVVAAGGYPGPYAKGTPMVVNSPTSPGITVFHAGTKLSSEGQLQTSGGRVIAVNATADSLEAAVKKAYEQGIPLIQFDKMYCRKDIAHRAFRSQQQREALTYAGAGVSVDAGNEFVERIKKAVRATKQPGADAEIGGFGGELDLAKCGLQLDEGQLPVLVGAIDGVGTKLMIAQSMGKHDTVGIDLVAMNVNDLVVQGARPLMFLDYYGCSRLDLSTAASFVEGVAAGCIDAGCTLVGGETAEMPGMYQKDDYDAAGCAVGVMVNSHRLPRKNEMAPGDILLGLASSGVHSNGFSLVRRILEREALAYTDEAPWDAGKTVGDSLLTPTKIYVKSLRGVIEARLVKGLAHITGGGLIDNVPRMLPDHLGAEVDLTTWEMPAVFKWLKTSGNVEPYQMVRTFNTGVGMVAAVDPALEKEAVESLEAAGERVLRLGRLVQRSADEPQCKVLNLESWT
ncbi:bifunctional purine biosynthetic protein [Colletotrichum kahawae]|uniref:Bifunctional purine biosynthetic protein n=1 Tax=Colletotrichum kahawae TaxID=34407 RepID=A0AAD9Y670_COLKA|nr:bifunctional purine biosynthetic protein [Colletotrichum kahawae]